MSVPLLAIDTATVRAAVALATADGRAFFAAPDPSARHGRALLPVVRDLLAQAGLPTAAVGGFAVGLGPGSYTGLRVGIMAAKTLAYANGVELAGFDSLELVARNAPAGELRVAVIADAQRGDVYAATFTRDAEGGPLRTIAPTAVVPFDRWSAELPAGTLVLGPAAATGRFAATLPPHARLPDDPDDHWPRPERLIELAREVWTSGRREDLWFLEPVYLRRSAAEEQWEKLGR